MHHDVSLITTLAAGFGLALVFGFFAERARIPALVGYLLAGIGIGPGTPGFVADVAIASQGHGRVGRRIAQALRERDIPCVVAERNRELVEDLRRQGAAAVSGDAADPAVLIQAHIADAAMLVIATPDTLGVRKMVETARQLNPGIEVVVRTHNEDESALLRRDKVGTVFFGEEELAKGMTAHVLRRFDRAAPA